MLDDSPRYDEWADMWERHNDDGCEIVLDDERPSFRMEEVGNELGKGGAQKKDMFANSKAKFNKIVIHLNDMAKNLATLRGFVDHFVSVSAPDPVVDRIGDEHRVPATIDPTFDPMEDESRAFIFPSPSSPTEAFDPVVEYMRDEARTSISPCSVEDPMEEESRATILPSCHNPTMSLEPVVDYIDDEHCSPNSDMDRGDKSDWVEERTVDLHDLNGILHKTTVEPKLVEGSERCKELDALVLELKVELTPRIDEELVNKPTCVKSRIFEILDKVAPILRLTKRHVDAILHKRIVEIDLGAILTNTTPSSVYRLLTLLVF